MRLRNRLAQHWEYLLAVLLMFIASGCTAWAATHGALGWAGLAIFSMFGFAHAAIAFDDASDLRQRMTEAVRRQERGEVL